MDSTDATLTILGLGVVTLLARSFFLLPQRELPMPPLVRRALKYAPLAALVAIIVPEVVMTRGALTTFSVANDVAKYFAIIPAAFASTYPQLNALNVMGLSSPASALLSAVMFNALIIIALIPLALRGVHYRPLRADKLLARNLLIYGVGGLLLPFIGIKLIDLLLTALGLV